MSRVKPPLKPKFISTVVMLPRGSSYTYEKEDGTVRKVTTYRPRLVHRGWLLYKDEPVDSVEE